jgi:hypothetical protein
MEVYHMEDLIKAMVVAILFVLAGAVFFGVEALRFVGAILYGFAFLLITVIVLTVVASVAKTIGV